MKTKEEFCIMPNNPKYSIKRTSVYCHRHEIFFGVRNRQKSIDDGLIVFLTPKMHNMSGIGVHFNRKFDLYLKQLGEIAWIEYYDKTKEDFIKRYGRNYL
ncbi:MAG: hypothetical protein HFJ12_01460 [Bacilli bacterium]|nr:hypothetical protein [Bacilli bacterium]